MIVYKTYKLFIDCKRKLFDAEQQLNDDHIKHGDNDELNK